MDEDELDTSNLQAHVVTPSARQKLLFDQNPCNPSSVGSSSSNTRSVDAETLISDLGRLAPSVAKDFVPKASAERDLVFRLINDVDFQGDEESYITMSYVWQKVQRDAPRKMVSPVGDLPFGWVTTVEQFPLPTSKGMFLGILEEREENEGLWFDQVCINQEDDEEKAIAVGAIDTIYRNARQVIVALDDIAATEHEVLFLRHYIPQYEASDLPLNSHPNRGLTPPFMQKYASFRSFLERILNSMWFERAWCAHEMRTGRNHIFLVPCVSGEGDEEHTLIRVTDAFFLHMLVLASELKNITSTQQTQIRSLLEHFGRASLREEQDTLALQRHESIIPSIPEPIPYIPLVAEIFRMKAGGNPRLPEHLRRLDANRDKTSIALNASGLPLALKPPSPLQRPATEDECLRRLLLVGLAARDPVTLCTTGTPLQLHDGSISWLCRPTALDLPTTHQRPPRQFPKKTGQITQGSDGRAEYTQLDLIFPDLPHRTQPNPHFPALVHRAREFIDIGIQYQVQSHTMWNMWQTPNHPRGPAMRNTFIQTLACVFECGPQWLLDISTNLAASTSTSLTLPPHVLETLFNPQLLVQNYIHIPDARSALSILLSLLSILIAQAIPWASHATERTHGPLIISTPPLPPTPDFPHHRPSGKAIVFAPFEHSKALLVAVPDAVKGQEYEALARGWILTPMNVYTGSSSPHQIVSWTLQGKGVLFGDSVFSQGLSAGLGPKCHRVYGPGAS